MKKQILLVGLVAATGLCAFFMSCVKEEGCVCEEKPSAIAADESIINTYTNDEMLNHYNANSCAELARNIVEETYQGAADVNCTSYQNS